MRALKTVRQHLRSYHLKSGVFHFYRGEHRPAADFLTRALNEEGSELSPADRRAALYYLVQTRIEAATKHESAGEMERAISEYRSALEVMPRYPDVHVRLGDALVRTQQTAEAIEHYRKALEINPLFVQAHIHLGLAFLDESRFDSAKEAFRQAEQARAGLARHSLQQAAAALDDGDPVTARELYQDAFFRDFSVFERWLSAGLDDLRAERWEDAVTKLEQAAALRPRFADVHNYLGVALAEQGLFEESVAAFRRSVWINPGYLVAWLNLAFTCNELGWKEETWQALGEVLKREPENEPALFLKQRLEQPEGATAGSKTARPLPGVVRDDP